jgi:hypothetical protein
LGIINRAQAAGLWLLPSSKLSQPKADRINQRIPNRTSADAALEVGGLFARKKVEGPGLSPVEVGGDARISITTKPASRLPFDVSSGKLQS